jgi:hypothetical protein
MSKTCEEIYPSCGLGVEKQQHAMVRHGKMQVTNYLNTVYRLGIKHRKNNIPHFTDHKLQSHKRCQHRPITIDISHTSDMSAQHRSITTDTSHTSDVSAQHRSVTTNISHTSDVSAQLSIATNTSHTSDV